MPPKFDRERFRRQAQKVQAMDSQQRAELKMRQMAFEQGTKALESHIRSKVVEIVPGFWRGIADWLPPKVWFSFWGKVTWVALQPGRFVRWLIFVLFIKPGVWLQRHIWQWGCWTEVDEIDERTAQVTVHRWFTAKYRCRFNIITQAIDREEVG